MDDTVERIDNATNAVMQSFSYGECYPAIDILRFITVLDQIQSGVVELARLSHKPGAHSMYLSLIAFIKSFLTD